MTRGKLLKIGEVAKQLGVAVSTIRKYEEAGLVLPVRTAGKHRLFSMDDLHWLGCVREMITDKSMTIEAIKRMLAVIPCWQLRKCPESDRLTCPAYVDDSKPCWMIEDTKFDCRYNDCRTCIVYKSVTHCDNIKLLLNQISYSI